MSLQETLTAVRENIPAVAVVFNNGQWGAEKKNQIDFYADRYLGTNLAEPELRRASPRPWARDGIKVDHPGPGRRRAAATPSPAAGRRCSRSW